MTAFNPMIGFERLFDSLHNQPASDVYGSATKFPPYDIIKTGDGKYLVEVSVAGFAMDDLEITQVGRTLVIKGAKTERPARDEVLHNGIAWRDFERSFTLHPDATISGARLANGILSIDVEVVVPEERRPRSIEIQADGAKIAKAA